MGETVQEERKFNKIEWFFYIILLPLFFTLVLTGIMLTMLGYDVVHQVLVWGHKLPYIERIVPDPAGKTQANEKAPAAQKQIAELNQQIAALNDQIVAKQQEVQAAQKDTSAAQDSIKKLKDEIAGLQKQMEDKRATKEETDKKIAELAKLYTSMSAGKAAAIIEQLSLQEGALVMQAMKPDQRADIVSKLSPQKAADLTILLKDTSLSDNDQIAALQQRVQALTKSLAQAEKTRTDVQEMVSSFSTMNAASVADIIINMNNTDKDKALAVLAQMSTQQRGLVLEQIDKKSPDLAATITSQLVEM